MMKIHSVSQKRQSCLANRALPPVHRPVVKSCCTTASIGHIEPGARSVFRDELLIVLIVLFQIRSMKFVTR